MFKGLVTLVTGGASGLGRATVTRFAEKGSKVVFCDLATSDGDKVAKEIGENVTFIPANVTSEEEVQNVLKQVKAKHGRLDVLVNCASIAKTTKVYDFDARKPSSLDEINAVLMNNVAGTFNVTRLSAGLIAKNNLDANDLRGIVINATGTEGIKSASGQIAMSAASGAIIGMSQPIALDLVSGGIRCVTVVVRPQQTPVLDPTSLQTQQNTSKDVSQPDRFAQLVQTIIVNPHINCSTIELATGVSMA